MKVALIHEVFFDDEDGSALTEMLRDAGSMGAEVAVLPELPLNEWSPWSTEERDEDAEAPGGPRQLRMSAAAKSAGVALVGGAIVRDPETGRRHNTALVYDASGAPMAEYRKVHLPEEEGYWETSHYEPGQTGPELVSGLSMPAGLQICSDVNRPQGFQLLAAAGAQVVFAPRASPPATWERWSLILRANALMSGAWLISVNRPRPEHGASIGGPSVAIDPNGTIVTETTDPLTVVELDPAVVQSAAKQYPGYLDRFPALYAEAWGRLAGGE